MMNISLLALAAALVGCGVVAAVVVLVVWAIVDNSRRKAPRDPEK